MMSFVSSSLKTGRLIFIWPLDSWWGHWLWHRCLEPPDLSDLNGTDEEGDAKLWSLLNLWFGEGKVTGVGLPGTLITPGLDLSLAVVPNLILCTLSWGHIWAPPNMQQLSGGLLVMETGLDYWSWMVLMQVEWSKDVQALLVQCILWWWLGNQLPAFTQAYWIGTKLGLFANPMYGSWQHECGILCLAQTQSS